MKLKIFQKRNSQGFTLIELLIVIALLGALAVGLLATVDPFEQLKKGRDTSTRNTAAEFYNAMVRYYAQRGAFPASSTGQISGAATTLNAVAWTNSISEIAAAGELKTEFASLAGSGTLSKIWVTMPSSEKVVICAQPESKAFRNDQNTKFTQAGVLVTDGSCPNATSVSCYVCFQ